MSIANVFYGWFDDANQTDATYDPPHPTICPLCGTPTTEDDVRTFNIMPLEGYAKRSYFYRTHKTCANKHGSDTSDEFIFGIIQRNGD
jgi:hypothetical protein